ncbi:MAG TPA: xanthine dehydrogenase family protein subunit M [Leeuwenhoekiella sp.]|nr:xanthine dehydrogenase family protein subunit M [Leeuwenhoekiella sp.]
MNNFSLTQVDSAEEAVKTARLSTENNRYIAGGTNLIDLMKYRVENPDHLLDINRLNFSEISSLPDNGLRLGATVTNADTAYHQEVQKNYPLLAKAILSGASTQLRNMATDGGNLMQRTRCYYFYDTATPCNKREPGSGCSALEGFNRIHAILGASEKCIATHPSDMCVALAALDATVQVTGESGSRSIPILEFHRLPGDHPEKDTNLEPGELITAIDLPEKGFSQHFEYLKVRDRPSYAFALVSVAAALEIDGSTIKDIRVSLGGVAHKPWRLPEVEQQFIDQQATPQTFEAFAEKLIAGAKGYGDNDFKIKLAKKSIVRALLTALEK